MVSRVVDGNLVMLHELCPLFLGVNHIVFANATSKIFSHEELSVELRSCTNPCVFDVSILNYGPS